MPPYRTIPSNEEPKFPAVKNPSILEAMMIELNISLEATEKTPDEIRQCKKGIDRQSDEFNQWMTGIKTRLDAIAGKIKGADTARECDFARNRCEGSNYQEKLQKPPLTISG